MSIYLNIYIINQPNKGMSIYVYIWSYTYWVMYINLCQNIHLLKYVVVEWIFLY